MLAVIIVGVQFPLLGIVVILRTASSEAISSPRVRVSRAVSSVSVRCCGVVCSQPLQSSDWTDELRPDEAGGL